LCAKRSKLSVIPQLKTFSFYNFVRGFWMGVYIGGGSNFDPRLPPLFRGNKNEPGIEV